MSATATATEPILGWRIGQVVRETGISKELIHHYLRQGLVPRSAARARYGEDQIRLLRQIRILRDEHGFSLDLIRRLFSRYDFDPARIEALTLSESLARRAERFASDGDLLPEGLSADTVADLAGVTSERLAEHVDGGIIEPLGDRDGNGDELRFSAYDANTVALCEHGIELGIPMDAFRTVASYTRIAFELEHAEFFRVDLEPGHGAERLLAELFVRREVAASFVQNVLGAAAHARFRDDLQQSAALHASLERILFRPSPAFIAKHGIATAIDTAQQSLAAASGERERWQWTAVVMMHAGRYREASFFLGQAIERWPEDAELRGALGRALVAMGDLERGAEALATASARVDRDPVRDPLSAAFAALCAYERACAGDKPTQALATGAAAIIEGAEAAVAAAAGAQLPMRAEVTLLVGWLLTVMPPVFRCAGRGAGYLVDAFALVAIAPVDASPLPGWRERLELNCAYLLFDAQARLGVRSHHCQDDLRERVCRLDPGCRLAEAIYLAENGEVSPGEGA